MPDQVELVTRLTLDNRFSSQIRGASRDLSRFEGSVKKIGRGVGQVGSGLSRAGLLIGGAAVTGIGAAAKAAIDFEDAFAGVRKTVDASDAQFDALEENIRRIATQMPSTATELSRIAELGGAMGIPIDALDEFSTVVAKLGVTTDVAVDDAATALGQLGNILNLQASDFEKFGAALVDLGNKGSSTESAILEVTRRAGSSARLIELAKDETLGWAAAVANLGELPELAGTALQMFFTKSLELVSAGGKPLKRFAKVAGRTTEQFAKDFDKDASGALERFIKGLRKLPKDARLDVIQDLFGKRSGLSRVILGLADSYDKNLNPALDNANKAWRQGTALSAEAQKRFATVRSSIERLRNNLFEAALVVGEQFAPQLGDAANKLSEALQDPQFRAALQGIGKDIGDAIEGIDWDEVVSGAKQLISAIKGGASFAKTLLDAFMALPGPIKEATIGLIALNKLSGGLVGAGLGNIVGGVGEAVIKSLGARIPGIGKAFVQPVFVTNWPAGGLGGGLPGKAAPVGAAALGLGPIVAAAAAAAIAEHESRGQFAGALRDAGIPNKLDSLNGSVASLPGAVSVLAESVRLLTTPMTPQARHGGMSPDERAETKRTQEKVAAVGLEVQRKGEQTAGKVDATRKSIDVMKTAVQGRVTSEMSQTRGTVRTAEAAGASRVSGAVSSGSAAIVAAIWAARPQINVTNVTKSITTVNRYGPGGTSSSGRTPVLQGGP